MIGTYGVGDCQFYVLYRKGFNCNQLILWDKDRRLLQQQADWHNENERVKSGGWEYRVAKLMDVSPE